MPYVLVLFQVEDYPRWKSAFDDSADTRKAGGVKSCQLFHIESETNNFVILFEWDTMENARKFMHSPELKEKMQKTGVIGKPTITFIEKI